VHVHGSNAAVDISVGASGIGVSAAGGGSAVAGVGAAAAASAAATANSGDAGDARGGAIVTALVAAARSGVRGRSSVITEPSMFLQSSAIWPPLGSAAVSPLAIVAQGDELEGRRNVGLVPQLVTCTLSALTVSVTCLRETVVQRGPSSARPISLPPRLSGTGSPSRVSTKGEAIVRSGAPVGEHANQGFKTRTGVGAELVQNT